MVIEFAFKRTEALADQKSVLAASEVVGIMMMAKL
jgi:hypothetical protein